MQKMTFLYRQEHVDLAADLPVKNRSRKVNLTNGSCLRMLMYIPTSQNPSTSISHSYDMSYTLKPLLRHKTTQ